MIIESYKIEADGVPAQINIIKKPEEFVPIYELVLPRFEEATVAVLDAIRTKLITEVGVKAQEILDPRIMEELKQRFFSKSLELIEKEFPNISKEEKEIFAGTLVHEMLGLGDIEILLRDENLEDIVINNSQEPLWVYHRKIGWLKTNVKLESDTQIYNYASLIGRRVGRSITSLNPLMDAQLTSGDRVNSTLFPISTKGNTISIRKFARRPWTITDFMEVNTISSEVAALLWLAIQYELNIIISGGTGSGKTSFLNVLTAFIPPNNRVISIEDTREIQLPDFLHWVPMTTREPNPEGKGEVTMLDLMINALRMRPDRVIVGEIRRAREAEVLFEAMHTGHSVYATLHADTAEQTVRRMINPPINVPETMLEALHIIAVMHRDRRKGIRRTFQVAEIVPAERGTLSLNVLFRWIADKDKIVPFRPSTRVMDTLRLFTGMSDREIKKDIESKEKILKWMLKNKVNTVNTVGKVVSEYYTEPEKVLTAISKNESPRTILGEFARELGR
ncbi:MAG: ATPase, T2SS/T4P/T4SS family [Candidatus Aenigmarchaeota archaeon]|nr:ATPase, T2SS/T4P/T4SS family [Candidatus Aenigmarchaeota archaeon]